MPYASLILRLLLIRLAPQDSRHFSLMFFLAIILPSAIGVSVMLPCHLSLLPYSSLWRLLLFLRFHFAARHADICQLLPLFIISLRCQRHCHYAYAMPFILLRFRVLIFNIRAAGTYRAHAIATAAIDDIYIITLLFTLIWITPYATLDFSSPPCFHIVCLLFFMPMRYAYLLRRHYAPRHKIIIRHFLRFTPFLPRR